MKRDSTIFSSEEHHAIALQAYGTGDSQVRGPGGACAGDLPDCGLSTENGGKLGWKSNA